MQRSVLTVTIFAVALLSSSFANADGATVDFDDYRGRVVVLDFWASWCVPCRRSFPWLNEMHARYGDDGLVIVGVNLDNNRREADAFLAEFPAAFDIVYDPDAALAREYGVRAMPSSVVIGRDGSVRGHHMGFKVREQDDYEAAIVAALEDSNNDP